MKLDIKRYYQSKALFYLVLGFLIIAGEMIEVFEDAAAESQSVALKYFSGIGYILLFFFALIYYFNWKKLKRNNSVEDIEGERREIDRVTFFIQSRIIYTIIFIAALVSFVSRDWVNSINTSTIVLCLFAIELLIEGLIMATLLYYEQQEDL